MSEKALKLLHGPRYKLSVPALDATIAEKAAKQPTRKISVVPSRRSTVGKSLRAAVRDVVLAEMVRVGFKIEVVDNLRESGRLTRKELEVVIAPARTLAHRRKKGGRLSQEQSERALRVAEAIARAEETFGRENAHKWLRRPSSALDGLTPLSLLDTQPGTEAVLALLSRIEHGIAA
jgi:putative toxin-antitoxin system antitoxin component (TIGR02293 family)